MDLTVLYQVSYGMYVAGAQMDGRPVGGVINTVCQITSENPILSICLNRDNYTYKAIRETGRFSLSILSQETNPNAIAMFGFSSSREKDKFARFDYFVKDGLPYLREKACGYLTCQVLSVTEMETHAVIFARLVDTACGEKLPPMTYSYYYNVIKGKASKNAPTYQAPAPQAPQPEAAGASKWVCDVCGHVYEGERVPDDYKCPICGMDRSHFKEQ